MVIRPTNALQQMFYSVVWMTGFTVAGFSRPEIGQSQRPSVWPPEPSDALCYIQTSTGETINLDRLCGGRQSTRSELMSTTDRRFLDNYQRSLKKRLPATLQQTALARFQKHPQATVKQARQICNALQAGMSADFLAPQGVPEVDVLHALAPKYYCPQFHD